MIHIRRSWKLFIFQNPFTPCSSTPKFFHHFDLKRSILNESPPPHLLQQTMEQQPHRACERTKSKLKQNQVTSHSNWPRVLLFYLANTQCNGIIKGRLHCLTAESIGRCLVNKDWNPRTLATFHRSTSNNSSFLPYPPHTPRHPYPLKVGVICVSPLNVEVSWSIRMSLYVCQKVTFKLTFVIKSKY